MRGSGSGLVSRAMQSTRIHRANQAPVAAIRAPLSPPHTGTYSDDVSRPASQLQ